MYCRHPENSGSILSLRNRAGERGVALFTTLAILVLLVIIAIVFASVAGLERNSAHSRFEVERARSFAGMAITDVMAHLADNIPVATTAGSLNTPGPNCAWAVAPGRLIVPKTTGTGWNTVPLYSGLASTSTTGSVDLNQPLLGENNQHPIIPNNNEYTNVTMPVAWINVCQDGTRSIDSTYAPSTSNPIVGRYAYWTDTETSKVNLNTAGNAQRNYLGQAVNYAPDASTRTSDTAVTYPGTYGTGDEQNLTGHPSRVDLSQLDDAVTLTQGLDTYNYTASSFWTGPGLGSAGWQDNGENTSNGPYMSVSGALQALLRTAGQGMDRFNTIEDWVNTPGATSGSSAEITPAQVEMNRFYLTTRNWTPELTPWGLNKFWLQANPAQTSSNNNIYFPGDVLNAPGPPLYPQYSSTSSTYNFPSIFVQNDSQLCADYRDYVYPAYVTASQNLSTYPPDLLSQTSFTYPEFSTGPTAIVGGFQYLGAQTPVLEDNMSLQTFMDNMMFQMKRTDWPGMPSTSFVAKYGQQECEDIAYSMIYLFDTSILGGGLIPWQSTTVNFNGPPNWDGKTDGKDLWPSYGNGGPDNSGILYGGSLFQYQDQTTGESLRPFIGATSGPFIKEIWLELYQTQLGYTPSTSTYETAATTTATGGTGSGSALVNPPTTEDATKAGTKATDGNSWPPVYASKDNQQPGFSPPIQTGKIPSTGTHPGDLYSSHYFNVGIKVGMQLVYPNTTARNNKFLPVYGISDIEISASGLYTPQTGPYAGRQIAVQYSCLPTSPNPINSTSPYEGTQTINSASSYCPTGSFGPPFVWGYLDDQSPSGNGSLKCSGLSAGGNQNTVMLTPVRFESNNDFNTAPIYHPTDGLPNQMIFIGPFDANTSPKITLKFRALVAHMTLWTSYACTEYTPLDDDYRDYLDQQTRPGRTTTQSTKLVFTDTVGWTATGTSATITNSTGNTVTYNFGGALYDTKEASDPRCFRYPGDWINLSSNQKTFTQINRFYWGATPNSSASTGSPTANTGFQADSLTGIVGDDSKLAWPDTSAADDRVTYGHTYFDLRQEQNAGNIISFPGIGWLSVIPTNAEGSGTWSSNVFNPAPSGTNEGNLHPWRTISLEPSTSTVLNKGLLPDWLLLEAFALAYDSTYLSQTQGKININADIQPFTTSGGSTVNRIKPLEALLIPSYDNYTTSTSTAATIANALASYSDLAKFPSSYTLPHDTFLYPSEICEVASMGTGNVSDSRSGSNTKTPTTSQYIREALARDVVGLTTTQCSDFLVHVIAQSLAKNPTSATHAGPVLSEQRLEAVVSRVVDVGPDGIPGTSDDPAAPTSNGGTEKLKYDNTDTPLLGLSGVPPFKYQISSFKYLTQ